METIDSFSITTHYSLLKMEEPDNNEMEREIVKLSYLLAVTDISRKHMNFQFIESTPNTHWHSYRQNCLCHRKIRWRNRRRQGLRNLLRSVRDLKYHIYYTTDELSVARRKLKDLRNEMQKVKNEVFKNQQNLKQATHELTKAVGDLQAPQLYSLNDHEADILRYYLNLAGNDIEDARKNMQEAFNDLTTEVPYQSSSVTSGFTESDLEIVCTDNNRNLNSMSVTSAFPVAKSVASQGTNMCSVCLESAVNSVLYKCGHMCTCFDCAIKLQQSSDYKRCPVCRSVITDIIRIFVS